MSEHVAHDHDHGDSPEPSSSEGLLVDQDYVPRKAADVLELDMGDGFILYNHDSSLVHHLNPSAAIVWQVCDGAASIVQLAAEIADEYSVVVDNVVTELRGLIAELDALGLVEDARTD